MLFFAIFRLKTSIYIRVLLFLVNVRATIMTKSNKKPALK